MFDRLNALPADPLLGLISAFQNDTNPNKVDLGVGVYRDETGHTSIMTAVQKAAARHMETEDSKTYIGPGGVIGFVEGIKQLVFGAESAALKDGRVSGLQCPGGCGSLRIGAELLKRLNSDLTVWVSDPTWANHIPLISSSGLNIKTYPYFDPSTGGVNFEAMDTKLAELGPNDIVLLHGCCHNPTGADLSFENWQRVAERAAKQGFIPFIDIAYQGLGDGLEEDVKGIRYLSENVEEMLIATSCSKNFGLYRERVGTLLVQTKNAEHTNVIQTQVQDIARANYSMSPAYGGFLVDIILSDSELRNEWENELNAMATRMKSLRNGLYENIQQQGIEQDFSFINRQKGMFSYLGINGDQIQRLRDEFGIYMAGSSRINIAGLNSQSLEYVAKSLKSVL
ncbi:aromatic amino acid transaminase [Aliikangiella coralliicola]|uniref:Aminotransferase n=1 Tax=Aliikangiella coralliicola TaxID=2592383 RepID=A0A545UDC0_9GAMM|nr:amino acid aminotransferase [Aliikangiella coralliicola]TQV87460.1 aspartate/tyrosine/aromatic aminotransferase [Aliikangiella coralliicola]